jgi:hypothetical protein
MTPYLAILLETSLNNVIIQSDWKIATVVPIYEGGDDRSAVTNYRTISLSCVVCKQLEHVIAGYMRQAWENMIGYKRDRMGLDQDTHVKVKSSQRDRT